MSEYPAITEPRPDPDTTLKVLQELKETVEIITGQRGLRDRSIEGRITKIERDIEAMIARIRALE